MRLKKTVALVSSDRHGGNHGSGPRQFIPGTRVQRHLSITAAGQRSSRRSGLDSKETEKGVAPGGKQKLIVSVWDNDATPSSLLPSRDKGQGRAEKYPDAGSGVH